MLQRTRNFLERLALKRLALRREIQKSVRRRPFLLESLEDRRAMAILTVTTLGDISSLNDGVTSLREAINSANTNSDSQNTIRFSSDLLGNTINLANGEIGIRKTLQIDMADGAKLTIDAGNTSRIFHVYENVSLTVEQIELKNGMATNGGAIYVRQNGSLNLINSEFVGNFASNGGGAIFGASSAILQIRNSLFHLNSAASHGGAIRTETLSYTAIVSSQFTQNTADVDLTTSGDGGGVYTLGRLDVSQSQFSTNIGRNGGGIFGATSSNLNLSDSSFVSNTARETGGGVVSSSGSLQGQRLQMTSNTSGTDGGAMYLNKSATSVIDSDFNTNSATRSGGGIFSAPSGSLSIAGGSFFGNVAVKESGGIHIRSSALLTNVDFINNRAQYGGALSSLDSTTVTVSDSLFSGNQATINAGAIRMLGAALNVRNSLLSQNKAIDGGAIYVSSGIVNIEGTEFNRNEATTSGGALFNVATVNVLGGSFIDNKASSGGAIAANPSSTSNIDPVVVGTLITPTLFSGNYASNRGGVAYASSALMDFNQADLRNNSAAAGGGGALYLYGGSLVVSNSILQKNTTIGRGAAIYASPSSTAPSIALSNSLLVDNVATQEGGGVYLSGGSLNDQDSDFIGNRANRGGGAIWATSSSFLGLNRSLFRSNSGLGDGGAIRSSSSTLNITNSLLELNSIGVVSSSTSSGRGGALYASGGTVSIARSTLSKNTSARDGGALHFQSLSSAGATIDSCILLANVSNEDGGAIASSSSKLLFIGSRIDGNIANNGRGGALYAYVGSSTITNTTLIDNSASLDGGAIYADGSVTNTMVLGIASSQFLTNQSGDDGAAIFAANTALNIDATNFESNVSGDDGGAIYLKPLVVATVSNTQFLNNIGRDTAGAVFVRESTVHFISCVFAGNTVEHIANTGSRDDGKTGLLSYDATAIAHSSVRFTDTVIDGTNIVEATIATNLDQATLNAIFAQYPLLEDWI